MIQLPMAPGLSLASRTQLLPLQVLLLFQPLSLWLLVRSELVGVVVLDVVVVIVAAAVVLAGRSQHSERTSLCLELRSLQKSKLGSCQPLEFS